MTTADPQASLNNGHHNIMPTMQLRLEPIRDIDSRTRVFPLHVPFGNTLDTIAGEEGITSDHLRADVLCGKAVLLRNPHSKKWTAIGSMVTTKVNANVGTSADCPNYDQVFKKAKIAVDAGAHTLMDLSTVGFENALDFARGIRSVSEVAGVPVGTVPVYEVARRGMVRTESTRVVLDGDEALEVVERQAAAGASYMAIHAGLNLRSLEVWRRNPRSIVSKGGYITAEHMLTTGQENPFYERFDDLLTILKKYDVCLNVGSALRSGATRFNDEAQRAEIKEAGELARRANAAGVKTTVEGPGHVPMAMIPEIVKYQQEMTDGRPFFILGFLPTDCFTGWDHIVSAIGATEAVRHGVSWLCYITPAEHKRMPNDKDVKEGVIAARIAAHIGDCARGNSVALAREQARNDKGCLDPNAAKQFCSICGQDFCPIQRLHDLKENIDVALP